MEKLPDSEPLPRFWLLDEIAFGLKAVGNSRYRRQYEVGTPFCVTAGFETLGEQGDELKNTVTIRHRDSMEQKRMPISTLLAWLLKRVR
jgi:glycyl-tRNA synthetase